MIARTALPSIFWQRFFFGAVLSVAAVGIEDEDAGAGRRPEAAGGRRQSQLYDELLAIIASDPPPSVRIATNRERESDDPSPTSYLQNHGTKCASSTTETATAQITKGACLSAIRVRHSACHPITVTRE
jgi:hypothetical protein